MWLLMGRAASTSTNVDGITGLPNTYVLGGATLPITNPTAERQPRTRAEGNTGTIVSGRSSLSGDHEQHEGSTMRASNRAHTIYGYRQ